MSCTKEEFDKMWKASCAREKRLVEEYKRTHAIPSRATISTPEIEAERAEQKRLYGEYLEVLKNIQ